MASGKVRSEDTDSYVEFSISEPAPQSLLKLTQTYILK